MERISEKSRSRAREAVDVAGFDLNLLRVLDALLDERSVSAAARRLDLSQPATSAALTRLRIALNDPILVRHGNAMLPTPLAEELRPRVARVLSDVGEVLGTVAFFDPATTARSFRIGANDYATSVLLAPLAQRLRGAAPHATLELFALDEDPEARLSSREFDLIITTGQSQSATRDREVLFEESFVSIARADHPRLSKRPTLKEFVREDHALISSRGISRGAVDAALEASGQRRRVALTLPHFVVAPLVIAQTDLILTLPRRVAERYLGAESGLRLFKTPVATGNFDVAMVSHPRSVGDPPVQWLKQLIRSVVADMDKGRPR